METMLTEFDYFQPKCIQMMILDEYDEQISPATALAPEQPIQFIIPAAENTYTDISNSKLFIRFKITKDAGTDLDADTKIAPVNLILHSLFKSVDMQLNDVSVNAPDTLYAFRSYIESMLNFDNDLQETRGFAEGFGKDTVGQMTTWSDTNVAAVARRVQTAASAVVSVIGRPHIDLFNQEKDIPAGVKIGLTFTPHASTFALIANQNVTGKIAIVEAKFYARRKIVSPSLALAHKQMLEQTNMRIPYTRVKMSKTTLATGIVSGDIDPVFPDGPAPCRIFVALALNAAVSGQLTTNPFNFQNFDLTNITLKVNETAIPRYSYKNERAYMNLIEACGLDASPYSIGITQKEWNNGYRIYGFKITPTLPASGADSVQKSGRGRLSMTFGTALAAPVDVIVFAEYPGLVEVDRNGSVAVL